MPPLEKSLRQKIDTGAVHVGIIGLGYVGLPLAIAFIEKGFKVTGFDIDPTKVARLAAGEIYLKHLETAGSRRLIRSELFQATTAFGRLDEPDALIIAVPTPLTPQREPDMSYVLKTSEAIARRLRPGQLVVLESTTYPGTTEELVRNTLEAHSALTLGEDYFLAFSPEREDPGNRSFRTTTIPKVVAGVDVATGDIAQSLYDKVVEKTVRVSSPRTAEAAKLTENIFRAVNIALVNELKVVYDRMGIDIWEVLAAAETKPFGFMRFDPGPGWGGHCIPLDPFYLSWKAREFGVSAKFIELAGEVNTAMPEYVVQKTVLALNSVAKPMRGSDILILGVAYKRDVDDTRESPALEIMRLFENLGAVCTYHDPLIPELAPTRHSPHKSGMRSVPLTPEVLASVDAAVIVTDHTAADYRLLAGHAKLIIDSRGVYQRPEYAGLVEAARLIKA